MERLIERCDAVSKYIVDVLNQNRALWDDLVDDKALCQDSH